MGVAKAYPRPVYLGHVRRDGINTGAASRGALNPGLTRDRLKNAAGVNLLSKGLQLHMALTNMLPAVWSARILAKLEKNLVFAQPGVVNRDYEGDIRADGDRVHIHSFNDLTIGTYTKNSTTISYEQLTDTRVTLLIDQSKYFAFKIDDVDTAQMRPKLIDAASDRAAYQLAEDADSYVAGLYSGASTSNPDNTIETSRFTSTNVYQKLVDLSVLMDQVNLPAGGRFI